MNAHITTYSAPSIFAFLGRVRRVFSFSPSTLVAPLDGDDSLARRDFILEMMDRHPDAFSSDADIYAMKSLFPGRF